MCLQVWPLDCSPRWHGFRENGGVDGSERRGVGGATKAASRRVSQAGFWARPDISGLRRSKGTDRSLGKGAVVRTPTIFQWYQILRQHYQLTVFQAVRFALWLAR